MTPLYVGAELTGYAKILTDLTEKKRREEQLQFAHDELEMRVVARTKELAALNSSLRLEIEERKAAEKEKIDLLRKVVTSQEEERQRIARDLHDQLGQRLTALRLKIASLSDFVADDKEVSNRVARLQEIAERLDTEVSFLAWELRPSALDDLGLVEALRAFVKEWSRHYETAADFHANAVLGKRMRREAETHLYRIAQEALNNIVKHSKATEVTVLLERQDTNLILIIEDNGSGFDVSNQTRMHRSGRGLGLIGMSERASLIGGEVEIESGIGKGTTIFVRVPITVSRK
jgi:signal transduction histidine kinase